MSNPVLANLMHPEFLAAFDKLLKQSHRPTISRIVSKWQKKIQAELEDFEKLRLYRLEELAKKDEEGKPVLKTEEGQQSYDLDEDALRTLNEDISELLAEEVAELPKGVNLSELTMNMTPREVDFLIDAGILIET